MIAYNQTRELQVRDKQTWVEWMQYRLHYKKIKLRKRGRLQIMINVSKTKINVNRTEI